MRINGNNGRIVLLAIACVITLGAIHTAQAERPPSNWRYRGWSTGFNGSYPSTVWYKSTATYPAVAGGSGRGVNFYTWMVDYAHIWGRHCLRIKGNSHGTVDKGGGLWNNSSYGGHNMKFGWFEATTKVAALHRNVWPTWWLISPSGTNKDELDIMEYAWGDLGVTHWHWNGGQGTKKAHKIWYNGNSYIKSNLVDKFSMWSVKSTSSGGVTFFKDNGAIASNSAKVRYGMQFRITSGPNRRMSSTPKNYNFPNFYVDYVNIWTP